MYRLSTILVVLFFQGAPPVSAQAVDRAEAGEILLQGGVDGLKQMLASAGAPALTFDQEIQIRNLYDVYRRESERLVASFESAPASVRRTLADQLLLAAAKFLNPVQRDALGALADTDINSDLPTDPNELREYLRDLASPAASGEQNVVIDGFSGGRMPNRDEIMEIRINDNAFTAEQRFQGRGRTEIRTRGGTGQFNGDAEFEFEDESLDARTRSPHRARHIRRAISV